MIFKKNECLKVKDPVEGREILLGEAEDSIFLKEKIIVGIGGIPTNNTVYTSVDREIEVKE